MNILIFDTETIGKVEQNLLNVGYRICKVDFTNFTFTTIKERNYIDTALYNNKHFMINDDFVGIEKYNAYCEMLQAKAIKKLSMKSAFKIMENDIKKYDIEFAYAYNCDFDTDKFNKTSAKLGIKNPLESVQVFDIWAYAYKYIISSPEYKEWALENEQLTATKKFISGNVESVSRYLMNDLDFKESHTALDDTLYEMKILETCFKNGCDITRAEPKAKNVPSGRVFTMKILNDTTGEMVEMDYTSKYERNGVIYLK